MRTVLAVWLAGTAVAIAQEQPAPAPVVTRAQVVIRRVEKAAAAQELAEQAAAEESTAQPAEKPLAATAEKASLPSGPGVYTIRDERIESPVTAIQDGSLVLGAEPPRTIPFDEIARIELAGAPASGAGGTLGAEWLGQDNRDLVQPGSTAEGNGVQDVHVRLLGVTLGQEIKQIVAVRRKPSPLRVWRLDTSRSPHWKIAMRRGKGAGTADLFLEPTEADFFEHDLALTVTYEDGSRAKVTVTATTHTDHQLKLADGGAAATEAAPAEGPAVTLHLEGGDLLHGNLAELSEDRVKVRTFWQQDAEFPLVEVLGVRFDEVGDDAAQAAFSMRLADPTSEDVALVLGRDNVASEVAGSCGTLADGKLQFVFNDETRAINADRLAGLTFAAHPPLRSAARLHQVVRLVNGDRLSGELVAMGEDSLQIRLAGDQTLLLPLGTVGRVTFVNGRMVYLSDLEPLSVVETPYFGRAWSYQRDAGLEGGPLSITGREYKKGLAVHSRSVLRYALDGQFELFKARVGFDDASPAPGSVVCRVLADGEELFAQSDLRSDAGGVDIDVPLAGAGELTLEIDFGDREDTGDRVIWADARILRGASDER